MARILFVSGFHPATRARDLAYEFERFGPLVRCDVPAPRNPHASHNPYAFVDFRSRRDAEDAYYDMYVFDLLF
jgi:RNA recognition motif-containing protein